MKTAFIFLLLAFNLHALTGWTEPALITNSSSAIGDFSFSISSDNGCGYFSYAASGGGSNSGVYLKNNTLNAVTWTLNSYLSIEGVDSVGPVVAGRSGISFTSWLQSDVGTYKVIFKRGTESAYRISGSSNCSSVNLIAGTGNSIHAVWVEAGTVYYRKGFNNGVNWSDAKTVSVSSAEKPFVLESGSLLYVIWQGGSGPNVKFSKSEDGGLTWSAEENVSSAGISGLFCAVDSAGSIYAVWEQGNKIYFRKCGLSGWAMEKTVSTNLAGTAKFPSVAVDSDGLIYVVWGDNRTGGYKMYFAQSADFGETFSLESTLSNLSGAGKIVLTSYKKNLQLFWKDANQVYFRIKDTSAPFPVRITHPTHHPSGGVSNNNCPVFCLETSDNEGGAGIAGVSYIFDKLPDTVPPAVVSLSSGFSLSFPNTENGRWYLHARSMDVLGNWGNVSHAVVNISNNSLLPLSEIWCTPNPLRSGSGKLRYFTSEAAKVTVTIFNEAGEQVSTLEQESVAGVNELTEIAPASWANGVFLIKLTAKSTAGGIVASAVKKMVLLR